MRSQHTRKQELGAEGFLGSSRRGARGQGPRHARGHKFGVSAVQALGSHTSHQAGWYPFMRGMSLILERTSWIEGRPSDAKLLCNRRGCFRLLHEPSGFLTVLSTNITHKAGAEGFTACGLDIEEGQAVKVPNAPVEVRFQCNKPGFFDQSGMSRHVRSFSL